MDFQVDQKVSEIFWQRKPPSKWLRENLSKTKRWQGKSRGTGGATVQWDGFKDGFIEAKTMNTIQFLVCVCVFLKVIFSEVGDIFQLNFMLGSANLHGNLMFFLTLIQGTHWWWNLPIMGENIQFYRIGFTRWAPRRSLWMESYGALNK